MPNQQDHIRNSAREEKETPMPPEDSPLVASGLGRGCGDGCARRRKAAAAPENGVPGGRAGRRRFWTEAHRGYGLYIYREARTGLGLVIGACLEQKKNERAFFSRKKSNFRHYLTLALDFVCD